MFFSVFMAQVRINWIRQTNCRNFFTGSVTPVINLCPGPMITLTSLSEVKCTPWINQKYVMNNLLGLLTLSPGMESDTRFGTFYFLKMCREILNCVNFASVNGTDNKLLPVFLLPAIHTVTAFVIYTNNYALSQIFIDSMTPVVNLSLVSTTLELINC